MFQSTLLINIADDKHEFSICGNRRCDAGISSVAYSAYHAGILGWRNVELPKDEAKAYGKKFLLLCPECYRVLDKILIYKV